MSFRDRIKGAQNEIGQFKAHPVGDFDGVITEVKRKEAKDRNGNMIGYVFEVIVKTNAGTARQSIWYQTMQDIGGKLLSLAQGDQSKAEDIYVRAIARLCHTYKELGLGDIDGSDQEIEQAVYGRLGEWVNRPCHLAVRKNERDANNPYIYINAPKGAQHTGGAGASWPPAQSNASVQSAAVNAGQPAPAPQPMAQQAPAAPMAAPQPQAPQAPVTPGMDDIPF